MESIRNESRQIDQLNELKTQIISDLEQTALEKNISINELLKEISKAKDISRKTLDRIFNDNEISPSHNTIFKIYSYIYSTGFLSDLLIKSPSIIVNALRADYSNLTQTRNLNNKVFLKESSEITALTTNHLFNIIYFKTSGDFGCELNDIRNELGSKGLEILDQMIKFQFVEIDDDQRLLRKFSLYLTSEIRRNMLLTLVSGVYRPSKNDIRGANFIGILMGDVSPDDYNTFYKNLKTFFELQANLIINSKPLPGQAKRIVFGTAFDEIDKNDGDFLC